MLLLDVYPVLTPEEVAEVARVVAFALARRHAGGVAHGSVGVGQLRVDDAGAVFLALADQACADAARPADDIRALGELIRDLLALAPKPSEDEPSAGPGPARRGLLGWGSLGGGGGVRGRGAFGGLGGLGGSGRAAPPTSPAPSAHAALLAIADQADPPDGVSVPTAATVAAQISLRVPDARPPGHPPPSSPSSLEATACPPWPASSDRRPAAPGLVPDAGADGTLDPPTDAGSYDPASPPPGRRPPPLNRALGSAAGAGPGPREGLVGRVVFVVLLIGLLAIAGTAAASIHRRTNRPRQDIPIALADPTTTASTAPTAPAADRVWPAPDGVVHTAQGSFAVGAPGDVVLSGDWHCRGDPVPAVLRPSTGDVFVFDRWPGPGEELPGTKIGTAPGAVSLHASADACPRVVAVAAAGTETPFAPAHERKAP